MSKDLTPYELGYKIGSTCNLSALIVIPDDVLANEQDAKDYTRGFDNAVEDRLS